MDDLPVRPQPLRENYGAEALLAEINLRGGITASKHRNEQGVSRNGARQKSNPAP